MVILREMPERKYVYTFIYTPKREEEKIKLN